MPADTAAADLRALRHIFVEARAAYNLNALDKAKAAASDRRVPKNHKPAKRNKGSEERLRAAGDGFAADADALIRGHLVRDFGHGQLRPRMRAAYVQHAADAFLAGKRALGSLDPLTLEDQRDISVAVEHEGLTRGLRVGPRSLGALVDRITSQPPLPAKERAALDNIDKFLDAYVELLIRRAMAPALPAGEDAVARMVRSAQNQMRDQLATIRRRILTGTMTIEVGLAALLLGLNLQTTRAARRARAGQVVTPELQEELGMVELESQRDMTMVLLVAGITFAAFVALLVSAEAILLDTAVQAWLADRFLRTENEFYALAQAGEMAAFRTGTPAPPLDDVGTLPGAALPIPEPGALEHRVIVHWVLGYAEHCIDCVRLQEMSPFYLDTLSANGIHPGSGHTRCHANCRCHLEYEVPIFV